MRWFGKYWRVSSGKFFRLMWSVFNQILVSLRSLWEARIKCLFRINVGGFWNVKKNSFRRHFFRFHFFSFQSSSRDISRSQVTRRKQFDVLVLLWIIGVDYFHFPVDLMTGYYPINYLIKFKIDEEMIINLPFYLTGGAIYHFLLSNHIFDFFIKFCKTVKVFWKISAKFQKSTKRMKIQIFTSAKNCHWKLTQDFVELVLQWTHLATLPY